MARVRIPESVRGALEQLPPDRREEADGHLQQVAADRKRPGRMRISLTSQSAQPLYYSKTQHLLFLWMREGPSDFVLLAFYERPALEA